MLILKVMREAAARASGKEGVWLKGKLVVR